MDSDLDGPLPAEEEVLGRLDRHLRHWLGAWPPASMVSVVGSERRTEPGWDGTVRPFAGITTPHGTILSVPPDRVDAVRDAGATLETILDAVPDALGQPGAVVGRGVYRYALAPAEVEPVGEWVPADAPDVLVTGTPFVDVWQAVKPAVVGIPAWPAVPRGEDWKAGVCARLGVDPATMWPRILASVRSYADLEPALVGAVERLIDFVAEPPVPPVG